MDKTIITAGIDHSFFFVRFHHIGDGAIVFTTSTLVGIRIAADAHFCGIVCGQVWRDGLPGLAHVGGLEQPVAGMVIDIFFML